VTDMTELLVSAVITNMSAMRAHWSRHSTLADQGIIGTDTPIGRDVDLGGSLARVGWRPPRFKGSATLSGAAGFCAVGADRYMVSSMRENLVWMVDGDLEVIDAWSHPLLNDVHSVSRAPAGGVLLTSTGLDAVLEFDTAGRLVWSWFAHLHGFNVNPMGLRVDHDLYADHRTREVPTLRQSTHVNSAVVTPDDTVLATLFHQGVVIEIDRHGDWQEVCSGLDHPHWIRRAPFGWFLSDTRHGRLVRLDHQLQPMASVPVGGEWVADAAFEPSSGHFFVLESQQGSIREVGPEGQEYARLSLSHRWRGFALELR
jgi:hypothetical protein